MSRHERGLPSESSALGRRPQRGGRAREVPRKGAGMTAAEKDRLFLPAGTTADGLWDLVVTPESAGWGYSSLRVLTVAPGQAVEFATGDSEWIVLPLTGGRRRHPRGRDVRPAGRENVFTAVTDTAYLPIDSTVTLTGTRAGQRRADRGPGRPAPCRSATSRLRGGRVAARHRRAHPAGQQLRHGRGHGVRQAAGHRGAHPGVQLVVLPAAQARRDRRHRRRRDRAGGDLLLPVRLGGPGIRTRTGGESSWLPTGLRHRGAADRAAGGGHRRRHRARSRTAGTARRSPRRRTTCTT